MTGRSPVLFVTAALAVIAGAGCRQIFGIDDTHVAGGDGPAGTDAPRDGGGTTDAPGYDAPPPPDATVDAAPCPGSYVPVPGVGGRYRLVSAQQAWATAVNTCALDLPGRSHLLVIEDAVENTAVAAFASGPTSIHLGISDAAVEGSWVTVLGATQVYLPWAAGQPNGGTSQNCGQVQLPEAEWRDHDCDINLAYVCECL